jgi:hypothetical protein
MVDAALDAAVAHGSDVGVIADLAFALPFWVINAMLGVPASEATSMRDLAHTLTLSLEPLPAVEHAEEILAASDQIVVEHVVDAIQWKREHPANVLLSALVAAEADGDRRSPEELLDQPIPWNSCDRNYVGAAEAVPRPRRPPCPPSPSRTRSCCPASPVPTRRRPWRDRRCAPFPPTTPWRARASRSGGRSPAA